MHILSALLSTAALAATATADFYIYRSVQYITVDASSVNGYNFFAGPPSCDDVYNSVSKTPRDDVSGSKTGVRCSGCSTGEDSDVQVTVLEFNDDSYGHYTYYAESGELVDTDNNVAGTCNIDNSDSYNCVDGLATYKGQSQIFCSTTLAIP